MSRVLIVAGESGVRETLRAILRRAGYEADTACGAPEACRMCDAAEYDVVVTELFAPRAAGAELFAQIRSRRAATQVVVMTDESAADAAVLAVQSGADDCLVRPVGKFDLLRAVSRADRAKRLCDEKKELELRIRACRSELEQVVEAKTRALSSAMQSTVSLLATVVETRDPYTAGHQRRVGNLAAAVARRMGMHADAVETIRICGYIHDIGKITVPIEILCKPGRLSELEMKLIREHSQKGYELLSHVDLPPIFSEAVYQHHERCDGSGYPRGLTAPEILPEAKVIMVADVVEAMMSSRPYREPLGLGRALTEIRAHAGGLFDTEVVESCCALFLEDRYSLEETECIHYPF